MAAAGAATTTPTAAAAKMNGATNTIGIATAPALNKRERKSSTGVSTAGTRRQSCSVVCMHRTNHYAASGTHLLLCIPPSSCQEIHVADNFHTWPGRVHARESGVEGA